MNAPDRKKWQNYINGAFCDGTEPPIIVDNPATGQPLAQQACGNADDIDRAVTAAKACHDSRALSALRPVERSRKVQQMGRYLAENVKEIAPLLTLESGKPLWESEMEVLGAARYFEYYGNQGETVEGRSIPLGDGYYDFTVYEPYGVSGQIIPWNYPLEMTARSLSAALVTGNACVIKSPELDPLTHFYIAKAAESADMPAGAVNIVCGHGKTAGAALAAHPDVRQIVFTGSVETGIAVGKAAAQNIVPCVLELGGKSAAIVCQDADIDGFINDVRWGIYFNAGQVCSALSRVIVHSSLHDKLVAAVADMARGLSVGAGIDRADFGANMGAMISLPQLERAVAMCERAQAEGATLVCGGHRMNKDGFFMEPTVFSNVTPDMTIAREEAFAPVLSVMSYQTDDQAIAMINSTDYGLVGGVFTRDLDRAMRMAGQIRAGQVFINEWYAGGVETPFGGYGKSGYGREKGREALWNYVQTKNIAIKRG